MAPRTSMRVKLLTSGAGHGFGLTYGQVIDTEAEGCCLTAADAIRMINAGQAEAVRDDVAETTEAPRAGVETAVKTSRQKKR